MYTLANCTIKNRKARTNAIFNIAYLCCLPILTVNIYCHIFKHLSFSFYEVVVVVVVEIFIIKILKHWAFIMKIVKRKMYVQWRLPDYMNLKKPLWH